MSARSSNLHYAGGYAPELYDLEADPEELRNVAAEPFYANVLSDLRDLLLGMIDPEEINDIAIADQRTLINQHGGRDAVIARGENGGANLVHGSGWIVLLRAA